MHKTIFIKSESNCTHLSDAIAQMQQFSFVSYWKILLLWWVTESIFGHKKKSSKYAFFVSFFVCHKSNNDSWIKMCSFSVEYIHEHIQFSTYKSAIRKYRNGYWVCFLSILDYWVILHCMYGYTLQHTEMFLALHSPCW